MDETQKLEMQVLQLKAGAFDLQQQLMKQESYIGMLHQALKQIGDKLQVPTETNLDLNQILAALDLATTTPKAQPPEPVSSRQEENTIKPKGEPINE